MKQTLNTTTKAKALKHPIPINQESWFDYHELFFSITNPKSNITFANDVFMRLSKYNEKEMIGQLHKIIRHPDMPRAVFNIFWDFLKANKSVATYVKNLSKDGSYYWVMALAFPCKGGYLSVRLKPGSALFEVTKKMYAQTLHHEKEMEQTLGKKKAMESAQTFLLQLLKNAGFDNYEAFMHAALEAELAHQSKNLNPQKRRLSKDRLAKVAPNLLKLSELLEDMVNTREELKVMHNVILEHSEYVLSLSRTILLLSLNAQIGSNRLQSEEHPLSIVAEKMGEQSSNGEQLLKSLKENIHQLTTLISHLNFEIISAKLQVEMATDFVLNPSKDTATKNNPIALNSEEAHILLNLAYLPQLHQIQAGITKVPAYINRLMLEVKDISRFLMILRFIYTTGKVEIARLDGGLNSFTTIFDDLNQEINNADAHISALSDIMHANKDISSIYVRHKESLEVLIKHIS